MNRCKYAVLTMLLVFLFSSCSSNNGRTQNVMSSNKISKGLEQYIGKKLEELSKLVGEEPEITYSEEGENGYPESARFKFSDNIGIEGRLRVDNILATFINDTTMYIEELDIELPYENTAGIVRNDDTETVKKKLFNAGINFKADDESHIYFDHSGYRYGIGMYMKDYKAKKLIIDQPDTDLKFSEGQFNAYCKALPGGFYLKNGDYIAATAKGLAQVYKNTRGISLDSNMGQGKLYKTEEGIVFETTDGKSKYLINQNGIAAATLLSPEQQTGNVQPNQGHTNAPQQQNPLLVKFKEDVKLYQQYALDKWGYDTKRFYDVADFNNDGTLELYSIFNMSSPTAGTMKQSKLEIYTIKEGQVKLGDFYTVAEPMLKGGTDFTNYYKGSVPGEGDFIVIDEVNTRMGSGHSVRVGRFDNGRFNEVDSVDFAYPNMDLANGESILDYPRASELLSKYSVSYDNLMIGLDVDYSLLFGYAYNDGGNSYEYLRQLLSGDKDGEIIYRLTGEWRN